MAIGPHALQLKILLILLHRILQLQTGEERQQLVHWIGNMKLMKVPPKDSWDTASLRHVEILCYYEDGTLRQIITVLGDSYIRTHGMINAYKIL